MHNSCEKKVVAKQMENALWLLANTRSQTKMNYNLFCITIELVFRVRPRLPSIFAKIHRAQRAENVSGTEQNWSRIEFQSSRIRDFYEYCRQAEWAILRAESGALAEFIQAYCLVSNNAVLTWNNYSLGDLNFSTVVLFYLLEHKY